MDKTFVKEIMIPLQDYPHIGEWQTLQDAMSEMSKYEIEREGKKSLPRVILIFNTRNELVGIVRRRDIMRGLEPEFLVKKQLKRRKALFDVEIDHNISEVFFDKLVWGLIDRAQRPVREVMLPIEYTINIDDHLVKAVYEMVDRNTSILPVLEKGRVVGVIRSADLLRELYRTILEVKAREL